MRIKYIIPFPFDEKGIANRAAQIPREVLGPDTQVECVPVRNHGGTGNHAYEMMLFDIYCAEAGLRAEDEGYDAVLMDSVSDSGLHVLRSRLSIPVLGPGLVMMCVAQMLGKRFSIVTMWDKWIYLHERNLQLYGLGDKCASIRSVQIPPDVEALFEGKEHEMFDRIEVEARKALEEDRADVILLGSTTMHQAGEYLNERLPCPVINPGPLAIKMAEVMVQLGYGHSKLAWPDPTSIQDEKFFSLAGIEPVST
jgi:allantoin racemase